MWSLIDTVVVCLPNLVTNADHDYWFGIVADTIFTELA